MNGWQALGNALGGGIDREGAFEEGRYMGARTEDALSRARLNAAKARSEAQAVNARTNLAEGLVSTFDMAPEQAAGAANVLTSGSGNIQQLMQALQGNQQLGARQQLLEDPGAGVGDINRVRGIFGESAFTPVAVQGDMAINFMDDDPFDTMAPTPVGGARIADYAADTALQTDKLENPERHRSSGVQITLGDSLTTTDGNLPAPILPQGVDFSKGAGAPAFFAQLGNRLADIVGANLPFEEQQEAIQALDNVNTRTVTLLQDAVPGRPSNYLMQRLEKLALSPADFAAGAGIGRSKINQTLELMEQELTNIEGLLRQDAAAGSKMLSGGDRSQLFRGRSNIRQLISDYRMLAQSFNEPEAEGAPAEDIPSVPEGVDPTEWKFMSPEDRALWSTP